MSPCKVVEKLLLVQVVAQRTHRMATQMRSGLANRIEGGGTASERVVGEIDVFIVAN